MDAAQALNGDRDVAAYTKDQLVDLCRAAGWQGDHARTPKGALVDWWRMNQQAPDLMSPDHAAAAAAMRIVPVADARADLDVAQARAAQTGKADKANAATVAQAIAAALASVKLGADPDEIRAVVREELSSIQPARIVINGDAAPVRIEEATHPVFEKALRAVRAGLNVLLVGPAGSGKSYLAKQLAKALGRDFGTLHCSAGVSESQVTGWLLPVGEGGSFKFVPSQFAIQYTNGASVFLIDEIDAADPNMLTVLNGALANGALHIPQCPDRPEWKRGKDASIIAAANTYGNGADMLYVGRNQLDAATLDRFYVIVMDYDAALEAAIAGLPYQPGAKWEAAAAPTAQELKDLGQWVLSLRAKVAAAKLRRVVSTRTLQKAIAARQAGIPAEEVKRDLLAGWTRDELSKVGE
jgi:cobaltochelatase CobS